MYEPAILPVDAFVPRRIPGTETLAAHWLLGTPQFWFEVAWLKGYGHRWQVAEDEPNFF